MLKRTHLPLLISLLLASVSLQAASDSASHESKEDKPSQEVIPIARKKAIKESLSKALFLQAIRDLNISRVNSWLETGMDPDIVLGRYADAKPAILHAIQQIRPNDFWPKIKSLKRSTALRILKRGAYEIVEPLLAHGANPNIEGYVHCHLVGKVLVSDEVDLPMTPLCLTSAYGQSELVQLLLDYGADVQGIQGVRSYAINHVRHVPLAPQKPLAPIDFCAQRSTGCASEYRIIYLMTMFKLLGAGAQPICWNGNNEITLNLGNAAQYSPHRPDTIQADEYFKDCLFLDAYHNTRNALTREMSDCLPHDVASICACYLMDMDPKVEATLLHESLRHAICIKDLEAASSLPNEHPNMPAAFNLLHGGENLIQYAKAKRDQEMGSIFLGQRNAQDLHYVLREMHNGSIMYAIDRIQYTKKHVRWLDTYKVLYGYKALIQYAHEQHGSKPVDNRYKFYGFNDLEFLYPALRAACMNNVAHAKSLIRDHPELLRPSHPIHGSEATLKAVFGLKHASMLEQCFQQKMLMHIISLMRTHAPDIYQRELDQALIRNPLIILNKAAAKFPNINCGMNADFKFAAPIIAKFLGT